MTYESALAALRAGYAQQKAIKESKTIKVIKELRDEPVHKTQGRSTGGPKDTCRAVTMSGKPCPYKACARGLCKRHAL